jgi:hypothetical protein
MNSNKLFPLAGIAFVALAALVGISAARGAGGPPLPRPASGAPVKVLARGLPLPAGIAVGKRTVFVAAVGSEDGRTSGGIFALRAEGAQRIAAGTFIGITWHAGTLYAGRLARRSSTLLAFSGWNGRKFASRKVLRHARVGLTGLAVGPDGRLYAGGGTEDCDLCKQKGRYSQAVLSMRLDGSDLRVVARGYGSRSASPSRRPSGSRSSRSRARRA